jgi:hypothetical protein
MAAAAASNSIYPVDLHDEEATHLPFATKGPRSDMQRQGLPTPATYSPAAAADRRKRRIRSGGSRRSASCGGICCCIFSTLCGLLVTSIVVLGIAALIVWLILRPIRAPQYTVENIQFQSFNLSTPPQQSGVLNSDILLTIQANNPNKKIGIIYESITTTAFFDGNELGSGVIPPFYQGHQNITTVTSHLSIVNYALTQSDSDSLKTDIGHNSVPLEVRTSVKAKVKIGAFKSFSFWVHVTCNLNFSPPSLSSPNGTVINKSCKVTR